MGDREALLREAERNLRAQLREHFAPNPNQRPSLFGRLFTVPQTLDHAVHSLRDVLMALREQNDFCQSWRIVRSPEDHEAVTGLDPITQTEEYIQFLRHHDRQSDDWHIMEILAFSDLIYPDDPRSYSAQFSYTGGLSRRLFDEVRFQTRAPQVTQDLTFDQWISMIETITTWRKTRYLTVGTSSYAHHYAVFELRAWRGWIGWFPEQIAPSSLPDFAVVMPVGPGMVVATQRERLRIDREEDLERAAQVEMALADLGVLPLNRDLSDAQQ
ncbi:hypothetical protein [Yoonia sp. 2307UL14-13]|uniref:hypothetical protein n=1 Tax=Yoonia sp. 2307UL14-13 TaxID=3126506 RepID=UPI0030A44F38